MRYTAVFIVLPLLCLLPLSAQPIPAPPKCEVRAVWLTTLGGMDWPQSHDQQEQKESLRRIVEDLRSRNFNTIFFQVRPRGNAMYQSHYEPWAEELTGTAGRDPGWDPLEFLLQEAHTAGLEVHAWLNIAKVYGDGRPPRSVPAHVVDAHPSWAKQTGHEWWLDMGIPEAREFSRQVVMDVALRYNVDGIHFDYLRYPERGIEDWKSFRMYGDGRTRDDWRRHNLDVFVADVYRTIKKKKPHLKIGSAPIGIYQPMKGIQSDFTGYAGVFQDARGWLRQHVQDYVVPQLYWDLGNGGTEHDPDFGEMCREWTGHAFSRHIYAGIGVYKKKIREEIDDQIVVSRKAGAEGQAFFRYRHLEVLDNHIPAYRFPALIPPMPWIDSIPPLAPAKLTVSASGMLRWQSPGPATDGDLPNGYVIYRSSFKKVDTRDPRNILAIVPGDGTNYSDLKTNEKIYSYAVTALDSCNNESTPAVTGMPVSIATATEQTEVRSIAESPHVIHRVEARNSLGEPAEVGCVLAQNYPEPFAEKTIILYEIDASCRVRLAVTSQRTGVEKCLVDARQQPGTYIALFETVAGDDERYECRLEAGGSVRKILMRKH
ncbi:MAG: family 10 glycosylhydrolase [Ignavibacteriales bacterium]|nr:family 10 glycosylhydrolase [Ignavibacteriales bacterium]